MISLATAITSLVHAELWRVRLVWPHSEHLVCGQAVCGWRVSCRAGVHLAPPHIPPLLRSPEDPLPRLACHAEIHKSALCDKSRAHAFAGRVHGTCDSVVVATIAADERSCQVCLRRSSRVINSLKVIDSTNSNKSSVLMGGGDWILTVR